MCSWGKEGGLGKFAPCDVDRSTGPQLVNVLLVFYFILFWFCTRRSEYRPSQCEVCYQTFCRHSWPGPSSVSKPSAPPLLFPVKLRVGLSVHWFHEFLVFSVLQQLCFYDIHLISCGYGSGPLLSRAFVIPVLQKSACIIFNLFPLGLGQVHWFQEFLVFPVLQHRCLYTF